MRGVREDRAVRGLMSHAVLQRGKRHAQPDLAGGYTRMSPRNAPASLPRDSSSATYREFVNIDPEVGGQRVGARFALAPVASPILSHPKQVAVTLRVAYAIPLSVAVFALPASATDAVGIAAALIGKPYVWGAEGPRSFDCSGLTQYAYQQVGIDLPRRAISQSRIGDATRRLRRGDLVFFSTDERRSLVTHVGIYEGGGVMINASKRHGRVRRDDLSEEYWADRFMFARRVGEGALDDRGDGPVAAEQPRLPRGDKRRTATRVIGTIADVLLRRGRR
jgi:cell wall-associated NlpC family hydrolase